MDGAPPLPPSSQVFEGSAALEDASMIATRTKLRSAGKRTQKLRARGVGHERGLKAKISGFRLPEIGAQ